MLKSLSTLLLPGPLRQAQACQVWRGVPVGKGGELCGVRGEVRALQPGLQGRVQQVQAAEGIS